MTRRELSTRADELRLLLIFVALQAFLLTVNPRLLPMWAGEAFTLDAIRNGVPRDVHPSLYFLLAQAWLKLFGGANPLATLRVLSAVLAVASTILLDRLWLRKLDLETRQWILQLWTFSPCLLLFARMACSYSLQVLLTILSIWCALRCAEESASWKRLAFLVASLSALYYTNYLPGLAVWFAANTLLLRRVPGTKLFLTNALVVALFAPPHWPHRDLYSLSGNAILEAALKLGYGFYSLAFGEAIPFWLLALTVVLAGPYLWVALRGGRTRPRWLAAATVATLLGYIGAAYSVSYPFMGAHLLFLLPLLIVAVGVGIVALGRFGTVFGILLFAANAAGVWSYYQTTDILNAAYLTPTRQMAAMIAVRSAPADTMVWVDGLDMDEATLAYYLPNIFRVRVLRTGADADAAWKEQQQNIAIHHVWFLRNPHTVPPNQAFDQLEQRMMGSWFSHTMHPYLPTTALYRATMKHILKAPQPPAYVYEVWEFRR